MKREQRRLKRIFKILIAYVTAIIFVFTQGGGLSFIRLLNNLSYTVEAAEAPLVIEFYNMERSETINTIKIGFLITNTSTSSFSLKNLKLRYYYTIDGDVAQTYTNDLTVKNYPESPTAIVPTTSFQKMSTPTSTADYYLEIGFTGAAGTLDPGKTMRLDGRFNKNDWSGYDQTNDYSFNSSDTTYTAWDKVTAYSSGLTLFHGVEPSPPPPASREAGAWYMFDSTLTGISDQSKDYIGNYGSAVLYGGAYLAPGRTRNGLVLDGVDDYANLPTGIVSTLNDFTVATWVKLDTISNWQRIFDFGKDTQVYMHLTPKCPDEANKGVKFAISQYGGWYEETIVSGYDLPVGVWKHVAVTLSGSTGILYIDGVEVGRNSAMTLKPSSLGSTANNYIGKSQHADPYLDGMIDDFQIYNRALSTAEIETLLGTVTRINDSDPGIVYSAGWNYDSGRAGSDYELDIHDFTSPDGDDYFEYTFTGTGINFIAPKFDGNSDADVYIDGVFDKTVSTSGSASYISQTVTYSKLGLTPGTHTLKVVFKNNTWGVIDALDVMSSNAPPTNITLSNATVEENIVSVTTAATLTTTDADAGDAFSYSLVAGEGSDDNATFSIAGDQLKILASPNFEVKNSYKIRVRTVDSGGLSYEKAFIIAVSDINEAPSLDNPIPDKSATEDMPFSFTFDLSTFSDPEGNSITYTSTLENGSALPVWITFNSGTRTFSGTPLNSDVGTISVKVTASDGNLSTSDVFAIAVANVNDAPTDISLSNNSITESTITGSVVGVLSTSDLDAGDSASYTLVTGTGSTDNGNFTIVGNELRTNATFNYETKSSYSIRIRTTDSAGTFCEKVFSINITDVNEVPTDITLSATNVSENLVSGTTVGTFGSVDPDAGNTFTYSLVSGTGASDNTSFSISGNQLKTAAVFNYEGKNSYSIRVRSTDNNGLTFEKIFNITVDNVNESPTLNNLIPDQNVTEDVLFSYQFGEGSFSDVDGDILTYTATLEDGSQLPDWLAFNGGTRTFSGMPQNSDVGVINVKVTANDGVLTASDTFTITVSNVNDTPQDITLSNSSIPENSASSTTVGTLSTIDVDAGDTAAYTLADGAGNGDNGGFSIVGNELRTNVGFDYETRNSYSIRIRTTDSQGAYYEEIFSINITDINEAPSDLTLSSTSVAEDSAAGTVVGTISSVDQDEGDTFEYTLVSGVGDADNGSFSITGNQLKTSGVFNFENKNSYSIRIKTTDNGGLSFEESFSITVTDVNEAPYAAVPIPDKSTAEDAMFSFQFEAGTFSDIDGNPLNYTATLENNDPLPAWLSFDAGTRTFSGTPANDDVGTIDVKVAASDGSLTAVDTFSITVTNVNDAPTDISLSNDTIPDNSVLNTTVGILTSNDVDVGDSATYTLAAGGVDNGSFTITGNRLKTNIEPFDATAKSTYSIRIRVTDSGNAIYEEIFTITITESNNNNVPTDIFLSGTTIDENAATGTEVGTLTTMDADVGSGDIFSYALTAGVGDNDNLSFNIEGDKLLTVTEANYEVKNTYNIRIKVMDAAGESYEKPFVIAVRDINEKPLLDNPVADQNAPEDVLFSFQFAANTFSDPDGDSLIYTASLEDNTALPAWLTFDQDTRTFSGTPQEADIGSINVKITASDTNLSVTDVFAITVNNTNDIPTDITLSKNNISESIASGSTVGVLGTADEDTIDTFTYSLEAGVGSEGNGSFTIDGNELKTNGTFNYESKNTYSIRLRTTDAQGAFYEEVFTINVTDVNETPSDIFLSNTSIAENLVSGTLVGELSCTDPDQGDIYTYALVSGAGSTDNGNFSISGNQLKSYTSYNYEVKNSYSIRVRVTDAKGLFFEKIFTISITNVEESITLDNIIPDQNAIEDLLFSFQFASNTFRDPDGSSINYTASLENGNLLPQWLTFTPETRTFSGTPGNSDVDVLSIKLLASDGSSTIFDIFTITVANVNDAPTDILLSNSSITEDSEVYTQVGVITASDVDIGDTVVFSLVPGAGDDDNASFTIAGNELKIGAIFDYEAKNSYSVRIMAEDSEGAIYEKEFVLSITNVNEYPTGISLSVNNVGENLTLGTNIGVFNTVDSDAGDTFSYSFAAGVGAEDNDSFSISGNQLKTARVFDYEIKQSYSIRVKTTDALGLSYEEVFTITVNDLNEKPLLENQLPDQNAAEGVLFDFQFAPNTFSDPEGDQLFYTASLANNNPLPAWITFTPETRSLRGTPSNGDVGVLRVKIVASDGELSESDTFSISVEDINNSPTDITSSANSIPENLSIGTTVGILSTEDLDTEDTFSYSFVSGVGSEDNGSFSITGNALKTGVVFDFETRNNFSIRIRTTDTGGLFYDKVFTISILDVEGDNLETPVPTPTPTPSTPQPQPIIPPPVIIPLPSPVPETGSVLLANLSINKGELTPSFKSEEKVYTLTLPKEILNVAVVPTAEDGNSTVKVNGKTVANGSSTLVDLKAVNGMIEILVTAKDGVTKSVYRVSIKREISMDIHLNNLLVLGTSLYPSFSPDILQYKANVSNDIRAVCVVPYASDKDAAVTVNGVPVSSGNISYAIMLKEGENKLVVQVTAEDVVTIREYSVSVFVDASSIATPVPTLTPEPTQMPEPTKDDSKPFFSSLEDLLSENKLSLKTSEESGGNSEEEESLFDDVPPSHWAEDFVRKLYDRGIIKGTDAESFAPNRPITRAEFTQIIVKSLNIPNSEIEPLFEDVYEADWYSKPVSAAAKFGIVVGRPDGSFAPNESITRQDVAVVLSKFLEKKSDENMDSLRQSVTFSDKDRISGYALDSVACAVYNGLIVGKPGNVFDPKGLTTRAEAVTVICKLLRF